MKLEVMTDAVKEYLKKEDLNYYHDEEKNIFLLPFSFDHIKVHEVVRVEEDGLQVFAYLPIKAEEKNRQEVITYMNHLNWKFRRGCFEMDPEDGEVRFRVYCDCEGLENISENMIENSIHIPLAMAKNYGDHLLRLIQGTSTAEEEIGSEDD